MNTCRTDSADYHRTPDWNHNDQENEAKRYRRQEEFWSIFVYGDNLHGDKHEALKIAEDIMLMDEDLYHAAIKYIADAMGESLPKTELGKQADRSARKFMNDAIDDGTDNWTGE